MSALDEILAELASVRIRLEEAVDALERLDLVERRDELRRQARAVMPADRSDLERQLRRLLAAWDRLQKRRIDPVRQAGGGSSGGDFGFASDAVRINLRIDAAAGREDLEKRIRQLKVRLAELEESDS